MGAIKERSPFLSDTNIINPASVAISAVTITKPSVVWVINIDLLLAKIMPNIASVPNPWINNETLIGFCLLFMRCLLHMVARLSLSAQAIENKSHIHVFN